MGTADRQGCRTGSAAFKGGKKTAGGKFSPLALAAADFAVPPETFGKSSHGGRAKKRQIEKTPRRSNRSAMTPFLDRHPNAVWLFSVAQGAAMLGFNFLLRALVS